ncbi:family 1 encapsulin nanocompartment shell protein [Solicola gregarius]|uniref:Type 1 encapsulin shell protein n=1 Tax=Solicola gregarius TaxID=2908642 RepID=A0AA46TLU0_9ACTN|nr:family 1 encapsulin nanocompartment shell protein [Solicola gregarius]UYM07651.1 bacteriocin family protein [Solicola gregarius]
MNNLHRELAPISDAAWTEIDDEARRTFKRWIAGRRIVDVVGPAGGDLAAVGTGHVRPLDDPAEGVTARLRDAQHVVELRVPFSVTREAVDDVERGAQDSDWQPVKDAVQAIALAEDRAIFHGSTAAGITGIAASSSNAALSLPSDVREIPETVAQALGALRLAGVGGPYCLLLSASLYTEVSETTDHGYPIRDHIARLLDGEIIWAPALEGGALLMSTRGGDYALHLGQDLSIGYLSHDAEHVHLYHQESLTFFAYTAEASVSLPEG